jgi:hypothetical protein
MTEEIQNKKNTIFIDDKEYDLADFNEDQLKCVAQLRDIGIQQDNLKMRFDQLDAAKSVFISKLKSSLES